MGVSERCNAILKQAKLIWVDRLMDTESKQTHYKFMNVSVW